MLSEWLGVPKLDSVIREMLRDKKSCPRGLISYREWALGPCCRSFSRELHLLIELPTIAPYESENGKFNGLVPLSSPNLHTPFNMQSRKATKKLVRQALRHGTHVGTARIKHVRPVSRTPHPSA
ncbi:hypothetical protein VNO78_25889 [Psophocarpus tetragonolobus]|uniref:Uncharacterized protein n=1 Tax=Psophocarpus tetragonolobus TaxID=3891 RepID=A0AAN9S6Q0_PSOTE